MKNKQIKYFKKEELPEAAKKLIEESNIVLDIGCGISPQKIIKPMMHICCEPYLPYIQFLQKDIDQWFDKNYFFINTTWEELVKIIPPKSVDTVFLTDVVEHLEKKKAKKLLKATEKIVKNQIVIFTPLGFIEQHHKTEMDAWGMKGAEWQEHRSGWYPKDFDNSWEILISKEYHEQDNKGKIYEEPKGAMWAIKTFSKKGNTSLNLEKVKDLHKLVSAALELKYYGIIRFTTFIFQQIKIYRTFIRNIKSQYFSKHLK